MLNRDPAKVIYISGHALESSLQPENSVQVKPWQGEQEDTSLVDLIPFLECKHWNYNFVCVSQANLLDKWFIFYSFSVGICCLHCLDSDVAKHRPADIRTVLASYQGHDVANEFIERSKEHQRSVFFFFPSFFPEPIKFHLVLFSPFLFWIEVDVGRLVVEK